MLLCFLVETGHTFLRLKAIRCHSIVLVFQGVNCCPTNDTDRVSAQERPVPVQWHPSPAAIFESVSPDSQYVREHRPTNIHPPEDIHFSPDPQRYLYIPDPAQFLRRTVPSILPYREYPRAPSPAWRSSAPRPACLRAPEQHKHEWCA